VLVSSRLDDHGHCVGATVTLSQLKHYDRHGLPAHSGPARAAAASAGHPVDPPTRIEDRERLAAHLNNVVMSGLMSIGMGLQGTREGLIRPEDKTRPSHYVEALDGMVREIRTTVFERAPAGREPMGLKHRLLEAVDESGPNSMGTSVEFSWAAGQ